MRESEVDIEAGGRVGDCIGAVTEPSENLGGCIRQFPPKIWSKETIRLDGAQVLTNLKKVLKTVQTLFCTLHSSPSHVHLSYHRH
jgi:hypothetical protein